MLAFAKSEKVLSARQEDGATLRQHYQMAEKAGRKCPQLIQPEIDSQVRYLWRWFCEVSEGKQYNGNVPNFLSWTELKSWADLLDRKPNEWEISTIRAMDREF